MKKQRKIQTTECEERNMNCEFKNSNQHNVMKIDQREMRFEKINLQYAVTFEKYI